MLCFNAAVIQLVECDLAKVDVVGSRPITRSSGREYGFETLGMSVAGNMRRIT